jgi:hypothetical protein
LDRTYLDAKTVPDNDDSYSFFLFDPLHELECFGEKLGDGCMAN